MPQIKLASWNIGRGATKYLPDGYNQAQVESNLTLIANMLATRAVDVMGLQEVDVKTNRSRSVDEPSFLRDTLGWPTRSSRFHPGIDFRGGEFGNATLINLSKPELSYKDTKIQRRQFKSNFARENRSALAIRVDLKMPAGTGRDYKNLWFVTTHFAIPFADWMPHLCELLEWTSGFSFPVLVCGDLNVPERIDGELTAEYHLMAETFRKYAFTDIGPLGEDNFTFARRATTKLDYMFLKDEHDWFSVGEQERVRPVSEESWVSDHWLITTVFDY